MKQLLILTLVCLSFLSCSDRQGTKTETVPIPAPLQEHKETNIYSTMSSGIRKSNDDLVDALYKDQVDSSQALQQLETDMDMLRTSKNDSIASFTTYTSKNEDYYASAGQHASDITDSTLRRDILRIINNNKSLYTSQIAGHSNVLTYINNNEIKLNDLHTALKILSSLTLMNKYQAHNLPSLSPLTGYSAHQNATISKTQALTPKH